MARDQKQKQRIHKFNAVLYKILAPSIKINYLQYCPFILFLTPLSVRWRPFYFSNSFNLHFTRILLDRLSQNVQQSSLFMGRRRYGSFGFVFRNYFIDLLLKVVYWNFAQFPYFYKKKPIDFYSKMSILSTISKMAITPVVSHLKESNEMSTRCYVIKRT